MKKSLASIIIFLVFLFNIIFEYSKYKDLKDEEVYSDTFKILNIYDKEDYYVLKLTNNKFTFFTSIKKMEDIKKLDSIDLALLSTKVDFISFLKGFYSKSLFYDTLEHSPTFRQNISDYVSTRHQDIRVTELFNALFLAIPISKEYRDIYTNFGISHLIAISGFHLGIIAIIVYWILYFPYSYLHQRYFSYRNRRFDIIAFTIFILLFYLVLTDIVPSLLRAFIMFVLGVYFLRRNLEVFSFTTLFITLFLIVSIFPKYLFSISMWFSIIGVFYIFLYLQYFKNLPKLFTFIFFNFWIFFVFNPIVHFFFYNTSYEQLLSPFVTLFFTLFYPLELFLHFFGYADILDKYIILFLNYKMEIFEVSTPFWFFISFVLCSLFSIFDKRAFICLNILLLGFNIYLYY